MTSTHLTRAFWVSVSQIAQVLLYSTDVLIVAWIFGPVTVVPYACTQKLIAVLANQPQILTQTAAPALSELRMGASQTKLFSVTSSLSLALMLGSGAVLVVVLAINRAFVSWWVGPDQYGGAVLTALFASGDAHPPLEHRPGLRALRVRPRAADFADDGRRRDRHA